MGHRVSVKGKEEEVSSHKEFGGGFIGFMGIVYLGILIIFNGEGIYCFVLSGI
jgi:hypothetical protein